MKTTTKKVSKAAQLAKDLIEIFLPDTPEHNALEIRWRAFLRRLQGALLHDQANNLLGKPGDWKTPSQLEGMDITYFGLLMYPDLKSIEEKAIPLRKLAREMYQAINDPETFNKAPETMAELTARLETKLPHLHRLILGNPAIRSNSENGRWSHRRDKYHGNFSSTTISVNNRRGNLILQVSFQPDNTCTHQIKSEELVEFAQELGIL